MTYTLIGKIRRARLKVAARKAEKARVLIDAALNRIDAALGVQHERGRPKSTLRVVRRHIAEAGFSLMKFDFSHAVAMLDEAIRTLEQSDAKKGTSS